MARPKKYVDLVEPLKKSKKSYRTLPLKDIYRITPERYKDRAQSARTQKLNRRISRDTGRQVILAETYTTRDHDGNIKDEYEVHLQVVQALEDQKRGKLLWNTKVKVSCSCLDFMFVDEVSLFTRANADVYFSNGERPNIKNPKLVPQCCKHLVKVIQHIRNRGW